MARQCVPRRRASITEGPLAELGPCHLCPLCGEEEDTSLHLLGNCCAIAEKLYEFFGRYFLGTGDLRQEHWSILLRFAKKPVEGFYNLRVNTGMRIGPAGGLSTRR